MPVAYADAAAVLADAKSHPLRRLELLRGWGEAARTQYREAERLAREGR
ncbi:MAG: hypothetical protein J0M02_12590 [Planctomycetes bacterium]|nr:hypothetical protein [Planctomycetota bacterium]